LIKGDIISLTPIPVISVEVKNGRSIYIHSLIFSFIVPAVFNKEECFGGLLNV